MIYVIRCVYWDEDYEIPIKLLKIGYCGDDRRDQRMSSYRTENPLMQPIFEIPGGTEEHEKNLHYKFREFLERGQEWFKEVPEIVEFFEEATLEDLENLSSKSLVKTRKEIDNELLEKSQKYSSEVQEFLNKFVELHFSHDKMRFLCEFLKDNPEYKDDILELVPERFSFYFQVLGPKRCYSFSYQMSRLEKEYQKQLNNQSVSSLDLINIIYETFKEGERYTKADLKEAVQGIYDHVGLIKTGKANDFEEWFEIKECKIPNKETGKRDKGFELIKRKYNI